MDKNKIDSEIKILEQGILNEVEGKKFYELAASQFDGEVAEIFQELAQQEALHVQYLTNVKKELLADGKRLAEDFTPPSPGIFQWGKIDPSKVDMALSVFSTGIQLEQNSVKFYEEARDKTEDENLKKFYEKLAKWEKTHIYELNEQYELYKTDWWAEQRFSAF